MAAWQAFAERGAAPQLFHKHQALKLSLGDYKSARKEGYEAACRDSNLVACIDHEAEEAIIYRVPKDLGRGGDVLLGVYKGFFVALKHYGGVAQDAFTSNAFLNELAIGGLAPAYALPVLGWATEPELVTVHRFLPRASLSAATAMLGKGPQGFHAATITRRLKQAADCVVEFQSQDLLHLDIKDTNFLLLVEGADGREIVKLCDFGSAVRIPKGDYTEFVNDPSDFELTFAFACPDLVIEGRYGRKTDVCSFGMMIASQLIFGPAMVNTLTCVSIPDLQSMLVRHLSSGERILTPYMKRMGIPAVVGILAAVIVLECTGPYERRLDMEELREILTQLWLACDVLQAPFKLPMENELAFWQTVAGIVQHLVHVDSHTMQGPGLVLEQGVRAALQQLHECCWKMLELCLMHGSVRSESEFGQRFDCFNQTAMTELLLPSEAVSLFSPLEQGFQYTEEMREARAQLYFKRLSNLGIDVSTRPQQLLQQLNIFHFYSELVDRFLGWDEQEFDDAVEMVEVWAQESGEDNEDKEGGTPESAHSSPRGSPLALDFGGLTLSPHTRQSLEAAEGGVGKAVEQEDGGGEGGLPETGPRSPFSQCSPPQQQERQLRKVRSKGRQALSLGSEGSGEQEVPLTAAAHQLPSDNARPAVASAALAPAAGPAAAVAGLAGEQQLAPAFKIRSLPGSEQIHLTAKIPPFGLHVPKARSKGGSGYAAFNKVFYLSSPKTGSSATSQGPQTENLAAAIGHGVDLLIDPAGGHSKWMGNGKAVFLCLPLVGSALCAGMLTADLQAYWEAFIGGGVDVFSCGLIIKVENESKLGWDGHPGASRRLLRRAFDNTSIHSFLEQHACLSVDGQQMVREPGLTIWHRTIMHLLRSMEAARSIPLFAMKAPDSPVSTWRPLNTAAESLLSAE